MMWVMLSSFQNTWWVEGYGIVRIGMFIGEPSLSISSIPYSKILTYENNTWTLRDSAGMFYLGHYDSDGDGREELYFYALRNGPDTFYIFEADSMGNFDLTREKAVYVDIASGTNMMMPGPPTCYFGDANRNGYRDIICTPYAYDSVVVGCEYCPWMVMFENRGDNIWERKVLMSDAPRFPPPSILDSDRDGKPEIAAGSAIYEVEGDSVIEVARWTLPYASYSLMVEDMDGDGRSEVVFYGFGGTSGILYCHVYILEADSNNSWTVVKHMVIDTSGTISAGSGNSGDIDLDGRPELLMGTFGRVKVYKAVGDDEYELIGVMGGSRLDVTVSNVYDLDGDGFMEFAVSYYFGGGSGITAGYEYVPVGVGEDVRGVGGYVDVRGGFVEVEGGGEVEIYGLAGRRLRVERVKGRGRIYVGDLPAGVYFVRFRGKTFKFLRR